MDHRVKFNKAPLIETIFQIQFPEILKISSEAPVAFQELIRSEYPNLTQSVITNTVARQGQGTKVLPPVKSYDFINAAGNTKVSLTNTFVAVSTLNYTRWEEFKTICMDIVAKTVSIYQPNIIQRVGLRYKDLISRSKWGMERKQWKDLIKAEYLGALAEVDENLIPRYVLDYEVVNPNNGLVTHNHRELVLQRSNLEKSMLIDNDYYKVGVFSNEAVEIIAEDLHNEAGIFFRNVFTQELEAVMEPVEL